MAAAVDGEDGGGVDGRAMSACLFEAAILLGSSALFYKFAWLYFREWLFAHHSFPPAKTKLAGSSTPACDDGTLSLRGAGRAFAATFALSCCIFELIILEFAGLLNPVSTALAWRACLGLMVVSLHWVLPFLLAFACLGEMGLGSRSSCVGALMLLSIVLVVASRLGAQDAAGNFESAVGGPGDALSEGGGRGGGASTEGLASVFSLEAGLVRVGVVGVASLALLSGFGAVNLPYQQLATLLRRVPLSLVQSRERRARLTLADIGQRKRRAVIAKAAADSHNGGGGGAAGVGGGNHGAKSPGRSLIGRVVQALTVRRSDRHSAQQAAEAETASLEQIARELFLEIADCRRIQEQQRRARTPMGRVLVGFGAVMFAYCLTRLWKAGVTVLWVPYVYGNSKGTAGGEGGEVPMDDPATRLVRFALSRHLLVDADPEGWSELISFVLIGILVLLQTRGFLVTMRTFSRASMISGLSIPPQVLSVLLSMLMGTYLTSSVILMRVNLPPRHRVAITAVLGGMRFSFYQRWFDTVFFMSGCATAVTLLVFHVANRNSDADHHDDHGATKRTDAKPSAGERNSFHVPGIGSWEVKGGGPDREVRARGKVVPDRFVSLEGQNEPTAGVRETGSRRASTKES